MEKYEEGHYLAVEHEARAPATTYAGGVQRRMPEVFSVCFFSSGTKYLQNSSRIQNFY